MAAPKENQFWKIRSRHGRDELFQSADLLWEAACEYFEWVDKHPFKEQQLFSFQGAITKSYVSKKRPYTMTGLCLYIGCDESYFRQQKFKENEKLSPVINAIQKIVYDQKFSGAASGFFNANIIARDLGLKEKSDITSNDEKITQAAPVINVYNTAPPLARSEDEVK